MLMNQASGFPPAVGGARLRSPAGALSTIHPLWITHSFSTHSLTAQSVGPRREPPPVVIG